VSALSFLGLDLLTAFAVILTIFAAAVLQSAVGFSFGLFATPILLWFGIPLPETVAMVSFSSFLQSAMGSKQLRHEIPWRLIGLSGLVRVVAMAAGVMMLRRITRLDPATIKFTVGIILCLLAVFMGVLKIKPREKVSWGWGAFAIILSGLLEGMCGMGGPPIVIWLLAHKWSVNKTRGFLFATFFTTIPVYILVSYLTFGISILKSAGIGLLLFPVILAGGLVGMPIGNRMTKSTLRKIVYLILLIIGLSSLPPYLLRG